MDVEIAGGLRPLDDFIGIDFQQRFTGSGHLRCVAAHDGTAHLAHLGDSLACQEVDKLRAFQRLVRFSKTKGGEVHAVFLSIASRQPH